MEVTPAYYSSDEEVAWGPVTLEEIKNDLFQKPTNIKNRESDIGHYSCYYTPSASMNEERDNKIINTTGTSAYYTPNESLQSEQVLNKNDVFLEKLNSIIESESSDNTELAVTNFTLAADDKRDTLCKILDSEYDTYCNLDNIQPTLVDNTVRISQSQSSESPRKNMVIDLVIEEESDVDSSELEDEVIEISDDSLFIPDSQNSEILSVGVKVEDVSLLKETTDTDTVSEEGEVIENVSITDSEDYPLSELSNSNNESLSNEFVTEEQCCNKVEDEKVSDRISQGIQDLSLDEHNISGIGPLMSDLFNKYKYSDNNNLQNPAPSVTNSEDTFESDSLRFNDTMEEMEMALKQGLDYTMPDDDDDDIAKTPVLRNTTNIEQHPPISQTKKRFLKTPNKYDYVQSPVGDYIRQKSPNQNNFKIPQMVVKKKTQTPTCKTHLPNSYKDIVSPIAVYLKNSPRVCLKQNVVAKTVPYLEIPHTKVTSNKENDFKPNTLCQLPTVLYKPGKKIATEEKELHLPANIKKMISDTNVIKHEVKVVSGQKREKLLDLDEGDLTTVDNTLLNETGENISFVRTKKAYIK